MSSAVLVCPACASPVPPGFDSCPTCGAAVPPAPAKPLLISNVPGVGAPVVPPTAADWRGVNQVSDQSGSQVNNQSSSPTANLIVSQSGGQAAASVAAPPGVVSPSQAEAPAPVTPPASPRRLTIELLFDTGAKVLVTGLTLIGRAPSGGGAALVALDDPDMSVSKTHLECGLDQGGFWVMDRGSTNGTALWRGGQHVVLAPRVSTRVLPGDRLALGQRRAEVRVVA
ncbi:MAG: FHA domain-containing protein [Propionibacteriaceae bacterium]|jgi:hypothetical protein|nr:FHA domain-containing protein [Propionibacteriaceae bacterium]